MAERRKLTQVEEENVPIAVRKYAEAMGLTITHPRVLKYAEGMRGRKADDEIIEGPFKAKSVWSRAEDEESAPAEQ